MTWGEQNSEEEAWEQLDYAVSQGINFIDTGGSHARCKRAQARQRSPWLSAHASCLPSPTVGCRLPTAAELYPVPPRPETCGRTEEYIGRWMKVMEPGPLITQSAVCA